MAVELANEIIESRTQGSKLFDLGKNVRRLVVSLGTLHYKDELGSWQDIDEAYSEPDTDGFSAKFTRCLYHARVADSGYRRIYPDRNDLSYWVELGNPFSSNKPTKEGNMWTWDFLNASVTLEMQGSALKFNATLKNKNAPISMRIPFKTHGVKRRGRLLYHNDLPIAELRAPFAVDALGNERDVGISFGSGEIGLSLDPAGLTYPIVIDPTLNLQVGASTDDCRRRLTPAYFSLTHAQHVTGASDTTSKMGCGMRFLNITIGKADYIVAAKLTFTGSENQSGTVVNTRISAEDVDDAATFANDGPAFDARWAARTTARVDWDAIAAWSNGVEYDSPEIRTVIQEIIDRAGWASGQDIVLFWEDFEDRSTHVAGADRKAISYDGSSSTCPKLEITYSALVAAVWNFFTWG